MGKIPVTFDAYDLGLRFGNRWLFRHLNFSLQEGECLSLIGPSGKGKSSLLLALHGEIPFTEGSVKGPSQRGMVYQDFRLIEGLSVWENALLGGLKHFQSPFLYRVPTEIQEKASRAMDRLGLSAFKDSQVARLSGGERQRLALVRLIVCEPKVILADEPFSQLDDENTQNVIRELADLVQKRKSILICSVHDRSPLQLLETKVISL
jgi:ABC-type phosphate/phosphonate transport system ATPase subunit